MRPTERISVSLTEEIHSHILRHNAWVVTPAGRWKWLQRKAWNFLNKRGAVKPYHEMMIDYKQIVIDPDNLIRAIMETRRYLFSRGQEPHSVFIGREDVAELMSDAQYLNLAHTLHLQGRYRNMRPSGQVMDLDLYIIPYMKGVLVL